ncbi:MAG: TonB-dependent receptor [Hyphomonas sp.]|uniref:TonB-dependent receptor n=1 Tax=Hyphomonas sp. TaxID=87 RepID=UPI0018039B6C|nr:TonB-dependent receptor [Hyphomonas sp.]MBA3069202.1 TonB-dependent receptor [Hyphomonas sp.]MBU4061851.1 TonB-dependent receptor [Alphaproteobacteria bacterium]MBU4163317.1 TonB-dependent receptor [Alphaproteobacteria bacterium]
MKTTQKLKVSASALVIAMLAMAPVAIAQSTDDTEARQKTVIVTATKRDASIQDVPFSINAQTAEDIARTGAANLEDVARSVAGLSIQNLGPGQSQVAIRGVSAGQIVRDQPGVKEQVGVYLDESVISLSLFTPDIDLFDLNRVETLRGPQGTLFGSGSVGGTVRYITNQPVIGTQEGSLEANVNTINDGGTGGHVKGMINLPLGDKVALRAVGYHTEYAGWIDAIGPAASEDVNSGNRTGGRIALTFQPTDTLTITPRIIYQEIGTDGFNRAETFNWLSGTASLPDNTQYLLRDEEFSDETLIADLTASLDLGSLTLTSVTSFIDRDILVSRDASALTQSVSFDLGFAPAAFALPSNLRDVTAYESLTQEVRLSSNYDGPFQWLGGVFYSSNDRDYNQRLPTPGYDAFTDAALGAGTSAAVANGFPANSPFNSDLFYSLEQWAVFGEASYDLTEKMTVTAGGRFYDFEEDRTISSGGLFANGDSNVQDTTSSDGFTPRVLVSYDATDTITLNAQASQGFRLGGVNDPLNVPLCTPQDQQIFGGFQSYGDEKLWNYEAGLKAQTGTVTFNTAVFYTDIEDLQVTLDAGSCSSRIVFNVDKAHTAGLEAELGWSPAAGLDFNLSASVLEAKFDSTVRDGGGNVIGGIEDGNRLPSVPELQLSAAGTYRWSPNWIGADAFVSGSVQHIGDRYTQPSDQLPTQGLPGATGLAIGALTGLENPQDLVDLNLDAYTTVNLSTGLEFADWSVTAYVNNLTDEDADLSFNRERGGRARLAFHVNQPRTFGITFRKAF